MGVAAGSESRPLFHRPVPSVDGFSDRRATAVERRAAHQAVLLDQLEIFGACDVAVDTALTRLHKAGVVLSSPDGGGRVELGSRRGAGTSLPRR